MARAIARGRAKHMIPLKASSRTWHISCLPTFHWPKQIIWPPLITGWGSALHLQVGLASDTVSMGMRDSVTGREMNSCEQFDYLTAGQLTVLISATKCFFLKESSSSIEYNSNKIYLENIIKFINWNLNF